MTSVTSTDGVYGEFPTADRDLNPLCTAYIPAATTTHLYLGNVYGNWIEVGFWEYWNNNQTAHEFIGFTEWGLNFTPKGSSNFFYNCIDSHSARRAWKIDNVSGSNWRLRFDCLDGSGVQLVHEFDNTTYGYGTAASETMRRGGTATGMSDHHYNLQYRSGSNWYLWPYTLCDLNTTSNWAPQVLSQNEYKVVKTTPTC